MFDIFLYILTPKPNVCFCTFFAFFSLFASCFSRVLLCPHPAHYPPPRLPRSHSRSPRLSDVLPDAERAGPDGRRAPVPAVLHGPRLRGLAGGRAQPALTQAAVVVVGGLEWALGAVWLLQPVEFRVWSLEVFEIGVGRLCVWVCFEVFWSFWSFWSLEIWLSLDLELFGCQGPFLALHFRLPGWIIFFGRIRGFWRFFIPRCALCETMFERTPPPRP